MFLTFLSRSCQTKFVTIFILTTILIETFLFQDSVPSVDVGAIKFFEKKVVEFQKCKYELKLKHGKIVYLPKINSV